MTHVIALNGEIWTGGGGGGGNQYLLSTFFPGVLKRKENIKLKTKMGGGGIRNKANPQDMTQHWYKFQIR